MHDKILYVFIDNKIMLNIFKNKKKNKKKEFECFQIYNFLKEHNNI